MHFIPFSLRSDPFFSRVGAAGGLFDDLDGVRSSHTTTFSTGNGSTIHITRTVIDGDGSVRREMRFRTPNTEPSRPTARVPPNTRSAPPPSQAPPTSTTSEARGQPDGASSVPDSTTNTNNSAKPPTPSTPTSSRRKAGKYDSLVCQSDDSFSCLSCGFQVQVLVLIMPHPLKVPLEGQLVSVRRQALKITSESSLLNEMVAIHLGLVQETTEEDNLIASMKDIKCSSFSAHCVVVLLKNM